MLMNKEASIEFRLHLNSSKSESMYLYKKIFPLLLIVFLSNTIKGQSTQLMSYNIRYDNKSDTENNWENRKEAITKLIYDYKPSILGIQEGLYNQVEYIDSCLTNYAYIGIGRNDGKLKGEFSAIYYDSTKYKVLKTSTFWLSETPDKVSIGWDAALERICTYGLFESKTTGDRLWIFNTHFDHIGTKARENSAFLILEKIRQINIQNYPVVLMGDLNLTPEEKPIKQLKNQLDDALEISKSPVLGPRGTFNGFNQNPIEKRIDYFFTKKLSILSYSHIEERLSNDKHISDHLPVLITIKVNHTN